MDTNVLVDNQQELSIMEKIPQGRYTREFREEAARLVLEDGRQVGEVGKNRKPLTKVEVELARVKRELAVTRMAQTPAVPTSRGSGAPGGRNQGRA